MTINFRKLQSIFIEKIEREHQLILSDYDVSFEIRPSQHTSKHSVRLKVFGQEFSIAYVRDESTETDILRDFYSRLHDYNTDCAGHHLICLKIAALEELYLDELIELKAIAMRNFKEIEFDDVIIEFTDIPQSALDEKGFPKFAVMIVIQAQDICTKEIDLKRSNSDVFLEMRNSLFNLGDTPCSL